jgi:hypothetical protein
MVDSGAKRIRPELLRNSPGGVVVPSLATINRILARQGLVIARPRKRFGHVTAHCSMPRWVGRGGWCPSGWAALLVGALNVSLSAVENGPVGRDC